MFPILIIPVAGLGGYLLAKVLDKGPKGGLVATTGFVGARAVHQSVRPSVHQALPSGPPPGQIPPGQTPPPVSLPSYPFVTPSQTTQPQRPLPPSHQQIPTTPPPFGRIPVLNPYGRGSPEFPPTTPDTDYARGTKLSQDIPVYLAPPPNAVMAKSCMGIPAGAAVTVTGHGWQWDPHTHTNVPVVTIEYAGSTFTVDASCVS